MRFLVDKILSIFNSKDRQIVEMRYGLGKYKGQVYENYNDIGFEVYWFCKWRFPRYAYYLDYSNDY